MAGGQVRAELWVAGLDDASAQQAGRVGGKAANLARMRAAGLAVPEGFCVGVDVYRDVVAGDPRMHQVLTELAAVPAEEHQRLADLAERARAIVLATEVPQELRDEIAAAYRDLGAGKVAVRSSATAEDLPNASFAGLQDTYLDVHGTDDVVLAVRRCWASLWTERAVSYRASNGIDHRTVAMGVLVQVLVDAAVSGVLFTANPVTGNRAEMVVDAAVGLGEAVVSGAVNPDHYVLPTAEVAAEHGCLSAAQLAELQEVGVGLQDRFAAPQDVEWSYDRDGRLWLLQSRPITTLFPLPDTTRAGTRAFLSVSAVQGVLQPLTPMGMSMMRMSAAGMWQGAGLSVDPYRGPAGFVAAAGRMYIDMTGFLRSKSLRKDLPQRMRIHGPRVVAAVTALLEDPRFATQPGLPFRRRVLAKTVLRYAGPVAFGAMRTLLRPAAARARAYRIAADLEARTTAPDGELTAEQRLAYVETVPRELLGRRMTNLVWILVGGLAATGAPAGLLGPYAQAGEVDAVLRGMPHNPTTEMDLELWRLAHAAQDAKDLVLSTPPAELAEMYRGGTLPDIGLDGFLTKYGRRAVAEIDVGVPRWGEDPAPVLANVANYLRVSDPEHAPDKRFARAAAEAEAKLVELVDRAKPHRPVRARVAGFLMGRAREIAGLRELPKFCSLHGYGQIRAQLLLVGGELVRRGLLDRADDIMFLDFPEAQAAVAGSDLRASVQQRREVHAREMARRHVPVVMLSDGTEPEALLASTATATGALTGMAASPGTATGPARVILDPAGAHVEPGEILVAPSTDPGWTPLFLTAGGLVTETGAPNSHGPTVAREYGIPAVISVPAATREIRTGEWITVDGYAGTVTAVDAPTAS